MSVRIPRFRPRANEVVEVDDLNETLSDVIEETAGRLNEHNFQANAFTDRTLFADDIGFRLFQDKVADDPKDAGFPSANTFAMPARPSWEVIDDLTRTIATSGGTLWVIASFQSVNSGAYASAFGIRVNGQLIPESVLGALEENGDPIGVFDTMPVVVEAQMPVPPGQALVEVVQYAWNLTAWDTAHVAHREMIIIELGR